MRYNPLVCDAAPHRNDNKRACSICQRGVMLLSKPRRTREHNGPTPHSVAIIAKPPLKKPPDSLILERRKKDEQRLKVQEEVLQQKHHDLKTQWEKETDIRIQKNTVKRRVDSMLKAEGFELEKRREKLRALLDAEEQQYVIEIDAQQETVLERQAKMRARAKALREKREQERLAYVEEKLDIRWREECDELRPILARKHQNEVFEERAKQIEISNMIKSREKEEEGMYAALWESDRIMKSEREERECAAAIQRNKDCLEVLEKQLAAIRLQNESAKKLKEEEARLMEEEKLQREAEERHLLQLDEVDQLESPATPQGRIPLSRSRILSLVEHALTQPTDRLTRRISVSQLLKEGMYAALWESDRIMKSEREERECAAAIQRNKDCLEVLEKQLAAIRLQNESAKKLKEEEARLMEEEKLQREAEERHLLQLDEVDQLESPATPQGRIPLSRSRILSLVEHALTQPTDRLTRRISVSQLLSEMVKITPKFLVKLTLGCSFLLALPLIFDITIFGQHVDYTQWRCYSTAAGVCANITNGGSMYTQAILCNQNPVTEIPSSVMFRNGTVMTTSNVSMDDYFVLGHHFYWTEAAKNRYSVRWGLYCESETTELNELICYGFIVGALFSGLFIDRFGRRCLLLGTALTGALVQLTLILNDSVGGFIMIQLVLGVIYGCYLVAGVVWCFENLPSQLRLAPAAVGVCLVTLGRVILLVIVVEIPDFQEVLVCALFISWVTGTLAITLPESIPFSLSHRLIPQATRDLRKISARWKAYSRILKMSLLDSDVLSELSLFVMDRRYILRLTGTLLIWCFSLLPFTNRGADEASSLELWYAMRFAVCFAVLLMSIFLNMKIGTWYIIAILNLTNSLLSSSTIAFTGPVVFVIMQGITEGIYVNLLYITTTAVQGRRATILGFGHTILGFAYLLSSRFYTMGEGGESYKIAISGCSLVAFLISLVFGVVKVKLARDDDQQDTLVIREKDVMTETVGDKETTPSSPTVPSSSSPEDPPQPDQGRKKYLELGPGVDNVLLLDSKKRRVDVRVDQDNSLIYVNVYREESLEVSTTHHRNPSLVLSYNSENGSEIDDVIAMERREIERLFAEATPTHTPQSLETPLGLSGVTAFQEEVIEFREEVRVQGTRPNSLSRFNRHMNTATAEVRAPDPAETPSDEKWRTRMAQLEREYDGEVSEYLEFFTPEPATPLPANVVTEMVTPGENDSGMMITLFPLSFTFRGHLQDEDEGRFDIDRLFGSVDSSEGHVEIDMENSVKRSQQAEAMSHHMNQIKLKARRQAKELQAELAIDMRILEALLAETENEKEEAVKRKGELHHEAHAYMQYLDEQVQKEKEAERELEALINEEVEKQWQKRVNQWQMEREARRRMTEEMVEIRRKQIAEKLEIQKQEQDGLLRERDELKAAYAEHERLEAGKVKRTKERNLGYQDDLRSQMAYGEAIKGREVEEKTRELQMQNFAEDAYQTKLATALQRPVVDRAHPLRKYQNTQNRLFVLTYSLSVSSHTGPKARCELTRARRAEQTDSVAWQVKSRGKIGTIATSLLNLPRSRSR
eukprot:sb/3460820/